MDKYSTKMVECECCICGETIYRSKWKLDKLDDGKPVCSRKCMGIKRTKRYTKPKYECFICGKMFHKAKNQIDRLKDKRLTCSAECSYEKKRIIQIEKIEEKLNITNFKEWLEDKYHTEEMNTRDIALVVYGKKTHGPNIRRWMEHFSIPLRSRTDAIALQWKDNDERREEQRAFLSNLWENDTEIRGRIIEVMQTSEYKEKQRISKTGERNGMYGLIGEKHPNWNPNLTDEDRLDTRKYNEYFEWRRLVFERDEYTCQVCRRAKGGNLTAHHLNGYHWDKKARTDVNNGVTLCEPCHKEFHSIYGYGDNNFFQFTQFQTSKTLTV